MKKLFVTAVGFLLVWLLSGSSAGNAPLQVSAVAIDPALGEALRSYARVPPPV